MDIAEMTVHGWKFQLANKQLSIASEQDPNAHLELSAEAAFSLLDYLYQYRDDLAEAANEGKERDSKSVTTDTTFATGPSDRPDAGLTSRAL